MTREGTSDGKAGHSPRVFAPVHGGRRMVLTLSERDPRPCSGRGHVLRVFLLPAELARGERKGRAGIVQHEQLKERSCSVQAGSHGT